MIKKRIEKVKKFVKEYKREIIICGVSVAGTIIGVKLIGKTIDKLENRYYLDKMTDLYVEAYNNAANIANESLIPQINAKYEGYDFSLKDEFTQSIYRQYLEEYDNEFDKILDEQLQLV